MNLPLTLACGPYDRTLPLALGQVRPAGIDLTYLSTKPEETFWRMTRHHEFDAAEMSMSSYLLRRSRKDDAVMAIPVFTSRTFRHSAIFVNANAGIERPEDIRGKRVGVPEYQITAAVWIRMLLHQEYGVEPSSVHWYQGGVEQTGRVEKLAINIPGVEITAINEDQTLSRMLQEGEVDVLIGARAPSSFDGVRVKRLFPDFRSVEAEYYRKTRIFPIMHTVVIRKELLDQHPWVARNLFDAFVQAKEEWLRELRDPVALHATLPWLIAELEATEELMGHDFWPYGLEANRTTLEALTNYSHSEGLAQRVVPLEELFAASTLDEYRI